MLLPRSLAAASFAEAALQPCCSKETNKLKQAASHCFVQNGQIAIGIPRALDWPLVRTQ
jgi:hypothetical protein